MSTHKVAILGSGNIGSDLMIKLLGGGGSLELIALVGVDPASDGLARARNLGVTAIDTGVAGLIAMNGFDEIEFVFDATSAKAHAENATALAESGITMIDLTPAAIGPFVVPPVNLQEHLGAKNVNMVTCGGQATVPVVAAISSVTTVYYAEIVASISSRSAGPGTRANIDEFTETTARALRDVGGAGRSKAIIVLNPAKPPVLMRDTVLALVAPGHEAEITAAVERMVETVAAYVPGYRLKQSVQFERIEDVSELETLAPDLPAALVRVSVYLEVEGAADYLPAFAGNLDIMTSAAVQVAEELARVADAQKEVTAR
ncbi:acetaldehyde dehydrogenase (acetylating) [Pseudarthrobacter sp. fls2-241-R2A-168]|uniref:acetaldehyde dehydrogenase (acetylating) n=1 Tax=Pseudarthrobacter sp. fls2-241-R2A-168 TaxID=3040304 RepID=UPI0025550FC4|nr:acetaldehyde dehydrogenase (acetylating) [Pseudarthrobacter sp. fls2-241-R2A-168]